MTLHTGIEIASIRRRVVALILDGVILFCLLTVPLSFAFGESPIAPAASRSVLSMATLMAFAIVSQTWFLMAAGATPRKMLMGLYVGSKTGQRVTSSQAIGRILVVSALSIDYFVPAAFAFTVLVTLISAVMVLVDPERRALHDRLAGTRVLRGRPPPKIPITM